MVEESRFCISTLCEFCFTHFQIAGLSLGLSNPSDVRTKSSIMAALSSPRNNVIHSEKEKKMQDASIVMPLSVVTRKSFALHGADEIVLLREKLNQIAVGIQKRGDNQVEHMEESSSEEDHELNTRHRRRRPHGHFHAFLPSAERTFTPPSSPQPRDVLRKQLRKMCRQPRSPRSDENNIDPTSDEPIDAMCVEAIEICPVDDENQSNHRSTPNHHHNVSTTYSLLNKCPEGFRKRKSVYEEDLELDGDSITRLKKVVPSQVTVLSLACHGGIDQVMEAVGTEMCS